MKKTKRILAALLCLLMLGILAIPAFADEDKVIHEVRLTITQPVVGEAPDKVIVSTEPDKYTAEYRSWIKRLQSSDPVDTFESGWDYGLVFYVHPADGYRFEDTQYDGYTKSSTIVYVNGEQARVTGSETNMRLYRAYSCYPIEQTETQELSFFEKIAQAFRDFFAKIREFFENLF